MCSSVSLEVLISSDSTPTPNELENASFSFEERPFTVYYAIIHITMRQKTGASLFIFIIH